MSVAGGDPRQRRRARTWGGTHINDAAESADSIRPIDSIGATSSIFEDGTCDHDDVLSGVGQFLDDKVDHLAQTGIFVLEELRNAEEQGGGFVGGELLAGVEQEGDLGEQDATSSWLYRGAVEETCCRGIVVSREGPEPIRPPQEQDGGLRIVNSLTSSSLTATMAVTRAVEVVYEEGG